MAPQFVSEALRIKLDSLTNAENIHACMWVFSTPYRTVSIQVEPCFVRKKQIVCHLNPFVWKPQVLDYRIIVELSANKRRWILLNELANAGSVHRGREEELLSYMFVSVFTVLKHVSFLGCVLHGTFCTCATCLLPTACLSLVRNKLTQL
jgi:hypothetical protein